MAKSRGPGCVLASWWAHLPIARTELACSGRSGRAPASERRADVFLDTQNELGGQGQRCQLVGRFSVQRQRCTVVPPLGVVL